MQGGGAIEKRSLERLLFPLKSKRDEKDMLVLRRNLPKKSFLFFSLSLGDLKKKPEAAMHEVVQEDA